MGIATRVKNRLTGAVNRLLHRNAPPRPDWWLGTPWHEVRESGLFDEGWYRATYADATRAVDALWHYVTSDPGERDPNRMFSTGWYLDRNPDVAESGTNPVVHYLQHGAMEGRDPGPDFDTRWYLRLNPDLGAVPVNPLAHYLLVGQSDGRRTRPRPRSLGDATVSVALVSGEPETAGHIYRVEHFADAVNAIGGRATVLTVTEAASTRASEIEQADIVLLWRTLYDVEIEHIARTGRRCGAVIVFDVDDLMFEPELARVELVDGIRSSGVTERDARTVFDKMRRTAELSDACTCPTQELATRFRRLGKPTFVLPNGFDDAAFLRSRVAARARRDSSDIGVCRIGYASGSLTHQNDFGVAAPAIADVLRSNENARLVVFRRALDLEEFPMFEGLADQIEWRDLVRPHQFPSELARFDVNIAPLEVGNPFCEAKSALKFFEAALVGSPTVASPTAPFREVIAHGENGFLAETVDEWHQYLSRLVRDHSFRRSIGEVARTGVLWNQGPTRRAQSVGAVLAQLLDDRQAAADAFLAELVRNQRPTTPPPGSSCRLEYERDGLHAARLSVVVTVRNQAGFVLDALESVRKQTVSDLDLVIVDDASTDGSLDRVREWIETSTQRFNRVVLLTNADESGAARSRNSAFSATETPYVTPLAGDETLLPECCKRLLDTIEGTAASFAFLTSSRTRYSPQTLVGSNGIDGTVLVRIDAWTAVGGYDDDSLHSNERGLWSRFAESGMYGVATPIASAEFRGHPPA